MIYLVIYYCFASSSSLFKPRKCFCCRCVILLNYIFRLCVQISCYELECIFGFAVKYLKKNIFSLVIFGIFFAFSQKSNRFQNAQHLPWWMKLISGTLREKCLYTEFFLVRIFLHLDWIFVFSLNTRKYGPEKIPYFDNFHAVIRWLV